MNLIEAGRAFLIPDDDANTLHLWFILTDPDPTPDAGRVVAVMSVTKKPHSDPTLTLMPGDHPFIHHETTVAYGTANYFPASKLQRQLQRGRIKWSDDMSRNLLNRVRAKLLESPYTPNEIKHYCKGAFPP